MWGLRLRLIVSQIGGSNKNNNTPTNPPSGDAHNGLLHTPHAHASFAFLCLQQHAAKKARARRSDTGTLTPTENSSRCRRSAFVIPQGGQNFEGRSEPFAPPHTPSLVPHLSPSLSFSLSSFATRAVVCCVKGGGVDGQQTQRVCRRC